jgi:hypothetical protein
MGSVSEYHLAFFGMDDEEAAAILNKTKLVLLTFKIYS